jgi:hypothetical protein
MPPEVISSPLAVRWPLYIEAMPESSNEPPILRRVRTGRFGQAWRHQQLLAHDAPPASPRVGFADPQRAQSVISIDLRHPLLTMGRGKANAHRCCRHRCHDACHDHVSNGAPAEQ